MDKKDLIKLLREEGYEDFIIEAFEKVKREDFISNQFKELSYINSALPSFEGQTISQPSCIAMMLEMLELSALRNKKNVKILEIGSGTGYVISLLSEIMPLAELYGMEIKESLAKSSSETLKNNKKIKIINKSGIYGFDEESPYDRILISASAPHKSVLDNLILQLRDSGIIVSPVGHDLIKIKKIDKKKIKKEEMKNAVMFVPLVDE